MLLLCQHRMRVNQILPDGKGSRLENIVKVWILSKMGLKYQTSVAQFSSLVEGNLASGDVGVPRPHLYIYLSDVCPSMLLFVFFVYLLPAMVYFKWAISRHTNIVNGRPTDRTDNLKTMPPPLTDEAQNLTVYHSVKCFSA